MDKEYGLHEFVTSFSYHTVMAMSQINPEDNIMKFKSKTLVALLVLAVAAAMTLTALAEFGSGAVSQGQTYTTEEMLTYAIQDEYMARAEYAAIIAAYGEYTPFTNLMEAEEYHITLLTGLFEAYGYTVPADESAALVVLPDSLAAALDVGAAAETNNIAMYETFLAQDVPSDVAAVFSALKDASGNHLTAFTQAGGRAGAGRMAAYGHTDTDTRGYGRMYGDDSTRGYCGMYNSDTRMGRRNGGNRNGSATRGTGWNRDNCPVYNTTTP